MTPSPVKRETGIWFQLDTNRINSRQKLPYVNQLETWFDNGVIELTLSEPSMRESEQGNDSVRRHKAYRYMAWATYGDTPHEQQQMKEIEGILFPGGTQSTNQKGDVEVVFNAFKYPAILVTNDGGSKSQPGGILGKRQSLMEWSRSIRIMTDREAVSHVTYSIRRRDERARTYHEVFGHSLPDWV